MPTLFKGKQRKKSNASSSGGDLVVVGATSSVSPPAGGDLYSTVGEIGIRLVSKPQDAEFDLCLVHGLTGNRETTWTHPNGTFWPLLLKENFPNARIMVYGYDANVVGLWKNASSETLRGCGNTLAISLANTRGSATTRPLYFVAHSLGGLVVEAALLASLQPNEPRLQTLATSLKGIIFMGTPHSGSHLAVWGWTVARLLNTVWRANHKILETLKQNSEFLKQVEQDFQRQLRHSFTHIKVLCFYETVAVTGVGFVVPEESAVLDAYTSCGIAANHMDMTKFAGARDAGFLLVYGQLRDWTREPRVGPGNEENGAGSSATGEGSRLRAETRTKPDVSQVGHKYQGQVTAEKVIMGNINVQGNFSF